ncbi:MAG: hypothetical protein ACREJM_02420, partial [Candidatus Saccharimonadales bacterium]
MAIDTKGWLCPAFTEDGSMMTGVNFGSRGIAASLLGGLLASVALGQAEAPSSRSVYQRRGGESARARSAHQRASRGDGFGRQAGDNGAAAGEPRRLPSAALGAQAARRLPRAAEPRGYSAKGLFPAGRALAGVGGRPPSLQRQNRPLRASPSQGVVPAFFPAPLAAIEASPAAEPAPAVAAAPVDAQTIAAQLTATKPGEHPLLPAIRWATTTFKKLDA